MKTILVPVDFSNAAKNAIGFAIQIAEKTGAKVNCLHAFIYRENIQQGFEIAKANKQKELNDFTSQFETSVEIENTAYPDSFENALEFISNLKKVDLIVMGTATEIGLRKIVTGSNATNTMFDTKLPLLIVPEHHTDLRMNDLLFTSDLKPLHRKAIEPLKELGKAFDATVTIAHVQTNIEDSNRELKELEKENAFFGEDVRHIFKHISTSDVSEGIRYFLDYEACDVLVMVRREYGFLDKLFRTNHTEEFADNPKLPVLVLHE